MFAVCGQDFSKGWGDTVCQSEGTHQIVMLFSGPLLAMTMRVGTHSIHDGEGGRGGGADGALYCTPPKNT